MGVCPVLPRMKPASGATPVPAPSTRVPEPLDAWPVLRARVDLAQEVAEIVQLFLNDRKADEATPDQPHQSAHP